MIFFLSGRRGSNPRHSAWKADALPTELLPLIKFWIFTPVGKRLQIYNKNSKLQILFKNCGESRIRTCEVSRQRSYSPSHLAALVSPQFFLNILSLQRDSNPRPRDYKSRALANWAMEAKDFKRTTNLYLYPFCECKYRTFFWNLQNYFKLFFIFFSTQFLFSWLTAF